MWLFHRKNNFVNIRVISWMFFRNAVMWLFHREKISCRLVFIRGDKERDVSGYKERDVFGYKERDVSTCVYF
jgi:hypothetical protein